MGLGGDPLPEPLRPLPRPRLCARPPGSDGDIRPVDCPHQPRVPGLVAMFLKGIPTQAQKKTEKKDGYSVLQLSLVEEKGKKRPPKPLVGHFTKSGIPPAKVLREFRFRTQAEVKEGDQFFVDIFQVGEIVHPNCYDSELSR